MSRRDLWKALYERFEPESPANSRWRADRPDSPAQQIIDSLELQLGTPRILLTGTVGTGKTTELLRVAEARERHELVVFLDLERHFSDIVRDRAALERIRSWEVCFLAALALIGTIEQKYGSPSQFLPEEDLKALETSWSNLASATGTPPAQFDVTAMGKNMAALAARLTTALISEPTGVGAAAGFGFAEATLGAIGGGWKVPLGRSQQSLPDQDSRIQDLINRINYLVSHMQQHRQVLFVIDGLDRIRDVARTKELFIDSQLISQLNCPLVVCAPFALRHHPSTATVRGFDPLVLVNEPVLLHSDPHQHGPGVPFFCELFERRTQDLGAQGLVPCPLLEELAYRSGGRARDFVKFIRELARLCYREEAPAATEAHAQKVLAQQRRLQETGLHKGHIRLLEQIANDPEHRLPEEPLAQELLGYHKLLPYPNESEWYYPHPLLTMKLIRTTSPGSTG